MNCWKFFILKFILIILINLNGFLATWSHLSDSQDMSDFNLNVATYLSSYSCQPGVPCITTTNAPKTTCPPKTTSPPKTTQPPITTSTNSPNPKTKLTVIPGERCYRTCETNGAPKGCYFKFFLEYFHTMGPACKRCASGEFQDCFHPHCIAADGIEKGVMSINRQIPGPPIHVCKNDLIIIDLINGMDGTSVTIHWHGIHQNQSPFMDGVPFITQCPIPYATKFRYAFWASEVGTQFYHSHSGLHKINGIYGALIIREPVVQDPNFMLYDHDTKDFTIVLSDWMDQTSDMIYPGVVSRFNIKPTSALINGRGKTHDREKNGAYTKTPFSRFLVEPKRRYRFRLINAASHSCNFKFQIENHTMIFIASDSFNTRPLVADTLFSTSGERYDFVIMTNQRPDDYWIRLRPVGHCLAKDLEQFAILRYTTKLPTKPGIEFDRPVPKYDEEFQSSSQLNHPNATCHEESTDYCITKLKSHDPDQQLRNAVPDHKFYLGFINEEFEYQELFDPTKEYKHFMTFNENLTLIGAVNKISLTLPSFSLLTQPEEINEHIFCNMNVKPDKCKNSKICNCLHRIKIQLNSIVELIIVDETSQIDGVNHPFHLHGYKFMVTDIGQYPTLPLTALLAKRLDSENKLRPSNFTVPYNPAPPLKDTVSIPSRGFAIVRFRATNPGFWLLHCHFEWHSITGMGVVLQVGETDIMKRPPKDFPKCGDFSPNLRQILSFLK